MTHNQDIKLPSLKKEGQVTVKTLRSGGPPCFYGNRGGCTRVTVPVQPPRPSIRKGTPP